MVDALVKANDYLQISSHIEDPAEYWKVSRVQKLSFILGIVQCFHIEF